MGLNIKKSDFAKNVLVLFSGTFISQIIPFLILPVLQKYYYSPSDFGVLVVFISFSELFANISSLGFPQGIIPTFGDIDDDGDIDMIIGDYNGRLHVFSNSSSSLNSMSLTLTTTNLSDDNGTTIDVGYSAKPILYDIDKDGKLDLIVGEENGNLNYYQNIGTSLSPDFRLESETLGNVDVSEWWTTVGNSTPFIFENDLNETQLFVGSQNGYIIHYTDLDGNLGGNFTQWDTLA